MGINTDLPMTSKVKLTAQVDFTITAGRKQGVPRVYRITQEIPFTGKVEDVKEWFDGIGEELRDELQVEFDSVVLRGCEERSFEITDE